MAQPIKLICTLLVLLICALEPHQTWIVEFMNYFSVFLCVYVCVCVCVCVYMYLYQQEQYREEENQIAIKNGKTGLHLLKWEFVKCS